LIPDWNFKENQKKIFKAFSQEAAPQLKIWVLA
jgi:hypothetical protein